MSLTLSQMVHAYLSFSIREPLETESERLLKKSRVSACVKELGTCDPHAGLFFGLKRRLLTVNWKILDMKHDFQQAL